MKAIRIAIVLAASVAPAAAQERVKFEPKFVVNVPFFQQVGTEVEQTITVQGGSELKLAHSQTFQFKWLPTKLDGDKWTVELIIEGMKLKVDIATNQVNYDSAATPTEAGSGGNNPALGEFFKNLKDTKFLVTVGKGGVIEKVDGRDEFLKKLGGANPQMEGILKKILTDESLKEMSDPMAGLTVVGDKAVNEKWDKKTNLPLGPIGSYDRTLTFTYKAKEAVAPGNDNVHKVEVDVQMAYKPPTEAGEGLLFRIKGGDLKPFNPKPGFFRFDATKGYVKEAKLTVSLKGTLDVALGNNTETKVELVQTQTTTLKTQDSTFAVVAGPVPGPGPGAPPIIAPPPMPPMPPKQ